MPVYAPDGQRLRNYSLSAVERLLEKGMVVVERNRWGKIKRATFRPDRVDSSTRGNPLRKSIPTGTYYSFEENIADTFYVWAHRALISPRDRAEILASCSKRDDPRQKLDSAEAFLQAVFRAVPLSCMAERQTLPAVQAAVECSIGQRKLNQRRKKKRKAHERKTD